MMANRYRDTEPFKVDRNGTKYYRDWSCPKCGGVGYIYGYEHVEGGRCFKCGGDGRATKVRILKFYTPEYAEKLAAQREKRQAKKDAQRRAEAPQKNLEFAKKHGFNENGEAYVVLGNTYEIKDSLKAQGCRYCPTIGWYSATDLEGHETVKVTAADVWETNDYNEFYENGYSDKATEIVKAANEALTEKNDTTEYVGEVGKRIEVKVTLESVYEYEYSVKPWRTEIMHIYTFKDDAGNMIVWKTSKCLFEKDWQESHTIKATVKEHTVYRDHKQTVVQRVKVAG